ncbi:MAG: hypothetical protein HC836_45035, partial [Richelia sp. RM2_1_2]|nr:hypothetical protein [Richelia sp. RM2_1_2]
MTDQKSIEQQSALDAWKKSNSIGIVQAVTGFGKSRVGVLAASEERGSVLVVTPTTVLRDVEWPNEFKKWGVSTDNVEFACIQSLYTKTHLSYDLIIADEIHLMAGEEYIQFFKRTKFKKLLGLTATIDSDSPILKLFSVIYTVTLKNALSFNAIAPFRIKNIGVELKERKRYESLTNTIDKNFGRIANK